MSDSGPGQAVWDDECEASSPQSAKPAAGEGCQPYPTAPLAIHPGGPFLDLLGHPAAPFQIVDSRFRISHEDGGSLRFLTCPVSRPIIPAEEYPCPKEHINRLTSAASVLTGSGPGCRRPEAVTSLTAAAQRAANAWPYEWSSPWLETKSCAGDETCPG